VNEETLAQWGVAPKTTKKAITFKFADRPVYAVAKIATCFCLNQRQTLLFHDTQPTKCTVFILRCLYYHTECSYNSFETWWHAVTHGRGSEGETGKWSG